MASATGRKTKEADSERELLGISLYMMSGGDTIGVLAADGLND